MVRVSYLTIIFFKLYLGTELFRRKTFTKVSKRELDTIKRVNDFVNKKISFIDDQKKFNVKDRWQSIYELFLNGEGDCEDYAIAKFYLLKEMGIPTSRLRLTYGRILSNGVFTPHMVLIYLPKEQNKEPLILDNTTFDIKPIKKRKDFIVLHSFNNKSMFQKLYKRIFDISKSKAYNKLKSDDESFHKLIKQLSYMNLNASEVLKKNHSHYQDCF